MLNEVIKVVLADFNLQHPSRHFSSDELITFLYQFHAELLHHSYDEAIEKIKPVVKKRLQSLAASNVIIDDQGSSLHLASEDLYVIRREAANK